VTGLLAVGVDPETVGIPMSAETLAHARRKLSGDWFDDDSYRLDWAEIQKGIPVELTGVQTRPYVHEYLEWFRARSLQSTGRPPTFTERLRCEGRYLAERYGRNVPSSLRKPVHQCLTRWRVSQVRRRAHVPA
jgi:hypothetical protein